MKRKSRLALVEVRIAEVDHARQPQRIGVNEEVLGSCHQLRRFTPRSR
jgi:hypothetical protein